jgi:protein-S-isoprenylcysteine O-methyltransferase Ste14
MHWIDWLYYRPGLVLLNLWIAWGISWLAAAVWSSRAEKRVSLGEELWYRIVLFAGGLIFAIPSSRPGQIRLWPLMSLPAVWACIAVAVIGFAFTWWARIYLGELWSGWITKKADHRIVDSGPYGIVRHPIYTGLLLAVLATMVAKGTLFGLIGALIITVGIWMKARLEERFLRGELGADAYDSYRQRVPMLIPFGPKSA